MSTAPADAVVKPDSMSRQLVLLLTASCFLTNLAFDLSAVVRYGGVRAGLFGGMFHLIVMSTFWPIVVVPCSFILLGLCHWLKWRRLRVIAFMAPVGLAYGMVIQGHIVDPATPSHRFEKYTGLPYPTNARLVEHRFMDAVDDHIFFHFECSPDTVQRIITGMGLALDEVKTAEMAGPDSADSGAYYPILRDRQDFTPWQGGARYGRQKDVGRHRPGGSRRVWFYHLLTNADRTQMILFLSSVAMLDPDPADLAPPP